MTFVASILGNRILATVLLAAAPIAAQVVPGNPSANSAVASALAQRKPVVPPARKSPPPTRAGFSPLTTKSELAATRVFSEPLVPVGGEPNVLENQALASALVAFEERKIPDDTSVLETYLNSFPRSPWTVSLHMNLGVFYYKRGAYSRCLVSWEKAWALGRQATALAERAVAQRALAELINMNARLGRMPRLSELLAEADTRKFSGHSAQLVSAGRAGLWLMENIPSEAFRCGPIAVSMVAKTAKRGSNVLELGLKQKSTTRGTSLDQLAQLASAMKAGLQPAFRTAEGEMIVPAVVHWKIGHFAALTQRTPTKINSKDATFGGDIWLTPSTLAEESSGYFLVPAGPLPKGWRAVGPAEAATVWGCGATTASDSDAWTATDHKVGGGCDSSGRGMPVYSFHTMLASLVLTDTPVGMTSPLGENLFFTLTYSQRASGQPTIFNHGNLGQNWTHNWTSWLDEDDSTAQSVTFHPPGGGARHFHYNANTATYDPEYNTGARLTRYEQGAGYVYNVVDTDGTIWTFTESDSRGNNQRLWLTAITDPEGNAITLSYDDYRLSDIVSGSTGYGLTFAYPPAPAGTAEYYRVASVSDKTAYARTAHIGYDGEGRLNSITDVGALTTTFEYEAVGSSFINKMISPYWAPAVGDTKPGVTTFATEQIGRKFSISATDDAGTERVEFNQISGETGMDTILPANELPAMWLSNSYIFDRNSFYWTKKAWAEGGGRDFAFAHIYHWQNKDFGSRVTCGNTLESEKPLLETRIWYAYPGQHDPSPGDPFPASAVDLPDSATSFPGSIASPSVVARKMNTPAGATTQRSFATYNEFGLPTEIIDPKGVVTSYGYSGSHLTYVGGGGQFYNVVVGTGTPRRPERIVTAAGPTDFTYNAAGQVLTTTRPDNGVTTFDYDGSGHLNFVDGPLPGPGDKTVFGRDVQFRVFSITNPSGHTTQFLYDNFDRVTRTTYPDTTYELFTYDKLDLHQVRDRRGLVTTYFHNSLRQLTQVTDPLGRISILEWCKCGSLGKLTYAGGQVVEWFYDAAGRLTSKQIASGVDSYSYDDIGRVEMTTDAKSQSKIFSYYANNTLEKITYSQATVATPAVTFTYDAANRMETMADGTGTTTFGYVPFDQLTGGGQPETEIGPLASATVTYGYDTSRRRNRRSVNSTGIFGPNFDVAGRATTMGAGALGTTIAGYVPNTARIDTLTHASGQLAQFAYLGTLGDHRLYQISHSKPSGGGGYSSLSIFQYGYDVAGQITAWTQWATTGQTQTQAAYSLVYDAADRLKDAVAMSGGVATKAFHYTYDNADNRLTEQAGTTSRGFNAFSGSLNQLNSQTAGGPLRVSGAVSAVSTVTVNGQNATPLGAATVFSTDLANPPPGNLGLTVVATTAGAGSNSTTATYHVNVGSGGSRTFSYDSNGNLMSDGIRSYTWDGADRLVTIFQSGNTTTFVYDGLGRRVREKLNGTVIKQWIWAGTELVEERDGSNAVTRRFYPQGEEINGVPYYYTRDHLGSVREMTDAAGNIRARYDYDPYGQTTKIAGDLEASFGFAGYYRHPGSGLYLTLYRAYDPNLARWLSRDPIGEDGGINLYAYVGNNPVNDVDPLGLYGVLGLEFDDGKSFLGNVGDYLGSASAGAGKGAAAYADGINPFGDPFQNARVYDPCKDSGTSSSKWLGKYVGREALATASGLRAAAFAGKLGRGTSWGSWINSNRYLRVGPGNLPKPKGAAAKFFGKGAGQNVPVLRIGNGKPAWYNHWDLRIWGGL